MSEPLLTCRKVPRWRRNRGLFVTPGLAWEKPVYCPGGVRHEGGVTLLQALARNVGTCRPAVKGEIRVGSPHEGESTDTGHRGGALSSAKVCGNSCRFRRVSCKVIKAPRRARSCSMTRGWQTPREATSRIRFSSRRFNNGCLVRVGVCWRQGWVISLSSSVSRHLKRNLAQNL